MYLPTSCRLLSGKEVRMDNAHSETPPELVFPPQVAFSWTLRGARAARVAGNQAAGGVRYRIAGVAAADELATLAAFCREHGAKLELDR
jgi:hypothetical protein